MKNLLVLSALVCLWCLIGSTNITFSQVELAALKDLYDATNGPAWAVPDSQSWNFSQSNPNPCLEYWYGIGCMGDEFGVMHVKYFTLNNAGLEGSLPTSMGNFSYLTDIFMNDNWLNGTIPEELVLLQTLNLVDLSGNDYRGPFPEVFLRMPALTTLVLGDNYFNGSIPAALMQDSKMTYIDLDFNRFSGSIPIPYVPFSSLMTLRVCCNLLSGNISENIGQYTNLTGLTLDDNQLTGSIPSSIGKLTMLQSITATINQLTGTIPPELCQCTLLYELSLTGNNLHGSLPDKLYMLDSLLTLDFAVNQLTGSFPKGMENMILNQLVLPSNKMTGFIPDDFGDMNNLMNLDLSDNHFSGTIPATLQNSSYMASCLLYGNNFHGTIPFSYEGSKFFYMHTLDLSNNQLTGGIPEGLSAGSELTQLNVGHNHLSGPLPESIANTPRLALFLVYYNHFTGPIPDIYGNFRRALVLEFDDNLLSGTVPETLALLNSLQLLFLTSNLLTGSLTGVFDCTTQPQIRYIDVSNNQFSGSLPSGLFSCPWLSSFTALSNCFSGPLPVEMCGATNLTSLVLDGLMSATSCQKRFFKNFEAVVSYGLSSRIPDGIPECLFTLPLLQTLHLSGNGLTGSLSRDLPLSPSLSVLSLSHNSLRGEIPRTFMNHSWTELDLSYNKITGALSSLASESLSASTSINTSLSLKVNRLSGKIPPELKDLDSIAILDGNIFACDASRSSLPPEDPDYQIYSCGSNSFNDSVYAWCAVAVFCYIIWSVLWWLHRQTGKGVLAKTVIWMAFFKQNDNLAITNVLAFGEFADSIRKVFAVLTVFIVCILLPTYIALSEYYDTYTHEYAWSVSGAYLSGVTPSVVLLLLLVLFGACAISLMRFKFPKSVVGSVVAENVHWMESLPLLAVVTWNIVLVTGINIAYVYIDRHYGSNVVQITQVFVALFKVTWNNWIVQYVLERQSKDFKYARDVQRISESVSEMQSGVRNNDTETLSTQDGNSGSTGMGLAVFVMLFNNIAAPFIATGYVSSNCFYDIVTSPPPVSVTYSYVECTNFVSYYNVTTCYGYDSSYTDTLSYPPPFLYSYQCASTFITTYANIFILMLTIDTFFIPLLLCVLKFLHERLQTTGRFRLVAKAVLMMVPKLLMDMDTLCAKSDKFFTNSRSVRLFKVDAFVVKIINIFAVLCTFGVILPPVAVICCFAAHSVTYQTQLQIGRFLSLLPEEDSNRPIQAIEGKYLLDRDCEGAVDMFLSGVHIIMPFTAIFFGLVLFDTLGDAVGWQRALVVPLLLCSVPFVLFCKNIFDRVRKYCFGTRQVKRIVSRETGLQYSYITSPEYAPLHEHEEINEKRLDEGEAVASEDLRLSLL